MRLSLLALLTVAACAPSPQARNSASAAVVLQQTGVPDFADASSAERAAIRHAPSGMVCALPHDGTFDVGVFPADAANPGAHCTVAAGQTVTSLVVVRFGGVMNLDTAFQEALATTAGQVNATPWAGQPSEADRAPPEGLPHYRIARFEAAIDGEPHFLRVAMSEARGWYLQQIVSGPLADANAIEARAGEEWRAALHDFAQAPAQ